MTVGRHLLPSAGVGLPSRSGAIDVIALALLLASCGAAQPSTETAEGDATTGRASEAWSALDPERAVRLAERARQRDPSDEAAQEILARGHLALGRHREAARALEGTQDPVLLRLRARAQIALGRFDDALASLEAAARHDREEDPWSESVLGAVRAASERDEVFTLEGRDEAVVSLEELPLPVVRVRVDTVDTLAIVGTGADFAVLDPSVRAASGAIDELAIGALTIRGVPYVTRTLAPVREALGAEIGMVIGGQLLLRSSATLDGPGRRLVLRSRPASLEAPTGAPLYTPTGAFLVVPVRVGEADTWMTLDTAGLFPIALGPGELLGDAEWRELEGGAAITVVPSVRIGDLVVEEIPFVRGLLGEEHARAVEAPITGSVGWALLEQMSLRFHPSAGRVAFE